MPKARILIVDDNAEILKVMKVALGRSYEVEAEIAGTKAVARALAFQPDLIILDLVMPGVSGLTVAEAIWNTHGIDTVPILFMSGSVSPTGIPHPILEKPFRHSELLAAVDGFLPGRAESAS